MARRRPTSEAAVKPRSTSTALRRRTGLPHRSPDERNEIAGALLGVTTWQALSQEFDIPGFSGEREHVVPAPAQAVADAAARDLGLEQQSHALLRAAAVFGVREDDDRTGRMVRALLADGAEEEAEEASVPAGTDHEEVGSSGRGDQRLGG